MLVRYFALWLLLLCIQKQYIAEEIEPTTHTKRSVAAHVVAVVGAVIGAVGIITNGQLTFQKGSYGSQGTKGGCHYNTEAGCVKRSRMTCKPNSGYSLVNGDITLWDAPHISPGGKIVPMSWDSRDYGGHTCHLKRDPTKGEPCLIGVSVFGQPKISKNCLTSINLLTGGLTSLRSIGYYSWTHPETTMVAKCCGSRNGNTVWDGEWERQSSGKKFQCQTYTCPKNRQGCKSCGLQLVCAYRIRGRNRISTYDVTRDPTGRRCSGLKGETEPRYSAIAAYGKISWYDYGDEANVWWKVQ